MRGVAIFVEIHLFQILHPNSIILILGIREIWLGCQSVLIDSVLENGTLTPRHDSPNTHWVHLIQFEELVRVILAVWNYVVKACFITANLTKDIAVSILVLIDDRFELGAIIFTGRCCKVIAHMDDQWASSVRKSNRVVLDRFLRFEVEDQRFVAVMLPRAGLVRNLEFVDLWIARD